MIKKRWLLPVIALTLCVSGYSCIYGAEKAGKVADEVVHEGAGEAVSETISETTGEAAGETISEMAKEDAPAQDHSFRYIHDPRENPEAMKDIVENRDAVYGFSPDPNSTRLGSFADYDWTDPVLVAQAKEERIAYHDSLESMVDILSKMRAEGASTEEMARAVSTERNRLRLAAYADDPEGLAEVKKSNLDTYGHEDGPTPDEMFEKYGSWTAVIQRAFGANMGMDACCGLYDTYYPLYIELGLVETEPAEEMSEMLKTEQESQN